MSNAAREAADCLRAGGGRYFRRLGTTPKEIGEGSRVYYVEDGYIRGYCLLQRVEKSSGKTCDTTGKVFEAGTYLVMDAQSWRWIAPIRFPGFQGWRYAPAQWSDQAKVVGFWRDPKPAVGGLVHAT